MCLIQQMKISEAVSTAISATNHAIQHGIDLFVTLFHLSRIIFTCSTEFATFLSVFIPSSSSSLSDLLFEYLQLFAPRYKLNDSLFYISFNWSL